MLRSLQLFGILKQTLREGSTPASRPKARARQIDRAGTAG
jgi:hypothetical protein